MFFINIKYFPLKTIIQNSFKYNMLNNIWDIDLDIKL